MIRRLSIIMAALAGILPAVAQTYPAAEGVLLGHAHVADATPAGSGPDFVTGMEHPGDGVDIAVRAPSAGFYTLSLRYASGSPKAIPVSVNGDAQGSLLFPATHGFETRPYGRIVLRSGDNTLRIGTDWGYADIASVQLTPATQPEPFHLSVAPVDPHASPETRRLFSLLTETFGKRTFAGQHDSGPRAHPRLAALARLTDGGAPAILGLDLLYYSQAWNQPGGDGAIEAARDWALKNHGIVELSWHWFSPFGATGPVWSSFSAGKTTFDASRIADKNSPEYRAIVADLDRIAGKLQILADAHVPVLWRPLHEAEGGWFWWGSRGPAVEKTLYRLMFDRFTRVHHLHNLIWVWTTATDPAAEDWYPGDDYVDIVGADLYAQPGEHGDFFTTFDRIRDLRHGRKPIALAECGVIPDLNAQAPWLWFLVWDDFIVRPDFNSPARIANTYADPRTITLSRLRMDH